jgi:tetratricopeptide (TPR) repeat protein
LYGGERNDAERWLNERGPELIAAEIEFITWDDRPDFQIERILSLSPSLLLFSDKVIRERWFATLVFCREKEKALSIAHEIAEADARAQALRSIAEALAKAGMATEALAAAREIAEADARAQALRSIAEALAKAGMATEAREAVTEALATVREIKDAYHRLRVLPSIAEALAKVGMVTEALAAAREIEDANARPQALRSIAEALAKAGMATEALATAREIEDANARAKALMAVVDLWLEQRQAEEGGKLLEEIQNAISKVFEDSSRSEALRHLAVILARLHSYRAARETAEQCSSSENRLAAYTAIFREYHIERNPSLAPLFAEQVKEEDDLG